MKSHDIPQSADRQFANLPDRSPADNWYGVSDAKERRKRQNRLNQRAHRFRTRLEQAGFIALKGQWRPVEAPNSTPILMESTSQPQRTLPGHVAEPGSVVCCLPGRFDWITDANAAMSWFMTSWSGKVDALWAKMPDADRTAILLQKLAHFRTSYQLNCPRTDHLLSLTRVNVHRAFVSNMVSLGITWEWMEDDSISPISMASPGFNLGALPDSLRPTGLQRSRVHHTWIDLFPCPDMRNNLIRAGNDWDDEELCIDIMGFWDGTSPGPFGLIVWGEPSDPRSWEVTEGFLKKWGWVIHGCVDLMWSTNYWRAKRGARPLFSITEGYRQQGKSTHKARVS